MTRNFTPDSQPAVSTFNVTLEDFSSVEEREQVIESALSSGASTVVIDARHLKRVAPTDQFADVVFFAKIMSERLRRYARTPPKLVILRPLSPFVIQQSRLEELRRISGLEIDLVDTL